MRFYNVAGKVSKTKTNLPNSYETEEILLNILLISMKGVYCLFSNFKRSIELKSGENNGHSNRQYQVYKT